MGLKIVFKWFSMILATCILFDSGLILFNLEDLYEEELKSYFSNASSQ